MFGFSKTKRHSKKIHFPKKNIYIYIKIVNNFLGVIVLCQKWNQLVPWALCWNNRINCDRSKRHSLNISTNCIPSIQTYKEFYYIKFLKNLRNLNTLYLGHEVFLEISLYNFFHLWTPIPNYRCVPLSIKRAFAAFYRYCLSLNFTFGNVGPLQQ